MPVGFPHTIHVKTQQCTPALESDRSGTLRKVLSSRGPAASSSTNAAPSRWPSKRNLRLKTERRDHISGAAPFSRESRVWARMDHFRSSLLLRAVSHIPLPELRIPSFTVRQLSMNPSVGPSRASPFNLAYVGPIQGHRSGPFPSKGRFPVSGALIPTSCRGFQPR